MKIVVSPKFTKNLNKRFANKPQIKEKLYERSQLFLTDPHAFELKDHQLQGERKDYRAFSVTGDIRVVYKIEEDEETIKFYDIGTHNQVY